MKKLKYFKKEDNDKSSLLIPTGSTLLNLCLSDSISGGFVKGSIVNIIGDSSSGKTFLAWSILAEAVYDKRFDHYDLIYDETEAALQFRLENLFGEKIDRVCVYGQDKQPEISDTIQDWYHNMMRVLDKERPFIYILDSFDALTSEEELERRGVGKGGWKTEKAVASSELLRQIARRVKKTESLVVIISQVRDNIGVQFGSKKTRSGGKALRFYCTHELWLAIKENIKRKKRDVGITSRVRCSKNKFTGKKREVEFDILFDYGIDDINSMIDWLLEEGFWSGGGRTKVDTAGDFINTTRDKIIDYIEKEGKEQKLRKIIGGCWQQIEQEIATKRKPKYG